jgi:hypothetical protein
VKEYGGAEYDQHDVWVWVYANAYELSVYVSAGRKMAVEG